MKTKYIKFFAPINAETARTLMGIIDHAVNDNCEKISLSISTTGGSVFHGISIYNSIKGLPIKIKTHNFGSIDSIGVLIYLAGSERVCVSNSRFLLHPIMQSFYKDQECEIAKLQEIIQRMTVEQISIIEVIAKETGKSLKDIEDIILLRKSFDANKAIDFGIAHSICEEIIPKGIRYDFINEP